MPHIQHSSGQKPRRSGAFYYAPPLPMRGRGARGFVTSRAVSTPAELAGSIDVQIECQRPHAIFCNKCAFRSPAPLGRWIDIGLARSGAFAFCIRQYFQPIEPSRPMC